MARRSPKIAEAIEFLKKGKAESFSHAARKFGTTAQGVTQRWRSDFGTEDPDWFEPVPDVVTRAQEVTDDTPEPTDAEKELAKKVTRVAAQRDTARHEVKVEKQTREAIEDELEKTKRLVGIAENVEGAERPEWLVATDPGDHHGTLVAMLSDYHIGEVVDPAEMAWYNAYNPDIAEIRLRNFFTRTVKVSRDYLAGVTYDGIVLPSLGDMVSGDIHDEFRETNEWSNYEAANACIPWLEEGVEMFADVFGKVHVLSVPGNHPRDSKKPRYKKRSGHNADTFIWWQVARAFRDDPRVTFDIPKGFIADFQVYDTRFRIEHGDEARGGSGIQGAMLPIALMTHRRRKQAEAEGHPFDVLLMGHWHQYMSMIGKGFGVNGAGKGYDEFARGKGFEPEPPQQGLMVVTPEKGIGVQAPLFVGKRSEENW